MLQSELLSKKLVMVTGKGGIGKSLVSSALALEARKMGKKVCLVESTAHDQIAPLFGSPPIGHTLRELSPGIFVINLNAQDNFKDFVIKHLGFAKLFEKVFTKPIVRSFIQMLPGIAELTLLGRLFYFVELDKENNFDIVIFDGFASGHFDSLMRTPDAVMQSGMTGPVIDETTRVRRFLNDKSKVGVVLVTVPEELIVSEALDFSQKLAKNSPAEITAVIANRCWPQLSDDMPNIPDSLKFSVDYWSAQEKAQKKNLERLQSGLKTINPTTPIYVLEERGSFPEPLDPKAMTLWIEGA
ncbi:MAG: ArsA-related P-loop ATPase, partial [Bdellovibrionota bacterium]